MKRIEYCPSEAAHQVLIQGNILAKGETPQHMFERVVGTLFDIERVFGTPAEDTLEAKSRFAEFVATKAFTPGTPTLTNAGREGYADSALSSCAIIPVDLRNKTEAAEKIKPYYLQNMGSGFNLTPYEMPIDLLIWLNDLCARETATGRYDRYIGNMASLHVSHPQILDFVRAKQNYGLLHFSTAVDVDDKFMDAAVGNSKYAMTDGSVIDARELLCAIADSAWRCGSPGIINLGRMNRDNPVAKEFPYSTTPPCAEMGMTVGETCQFGYINISRFVGAGAFDYSGLADAVYSLTRALDNAVEVSIRGYPDAACSDMARFKRKIGIGVSGLADLLLSFDLPYDSEGARLIARDIVSFITFTSKVASVKLAELRGPCEAMKNAAGTRYCETYLEDRFGAGTSAVPTVEWRKLGALIKETRKLRNLSTTTLPPAARVSILMDASFGIEPIFNVPAQLSDLRSSVKCFVLRHAKENAEDVLSQATRERTFQHTDLPERECLKTATEINHRGHLLMVAALAGKNGVVDEAASKTVNLSHDASREDVMAIFLSAHELGLKNITAYRDGSIEGQPHRL